MPKAAGDAKLLVQSLTKAYAATPTNLKIINLYVVFAVATALVQLFSVGRSSRLKKLKEGNASSLIWKNWISLAVP
ncbi:hypothetical protein TRIUR3_28049 [Triticum urartu]|uniref:Uncharacterized protein n=1 Tax=Triticum urartu TaxID=4572 RepID=M7ZA41_TRIUA|nr:hypothetical protein TRIUR3_28049 [Triticum urartu]